MTPRQKQMIDFIRSGPNQNRTSAELIDKFGRDYFNNREKYVGERLAALIRSGHVVRVKKGLYTVAGETPGDANQAKLF